MFLAACFLALVGDSEDEGLRLARRFIQPAKGRLRDCLSVDARISMLRSSGRGRGSVGVVMRRRRGAEGHTMGPCRSLSRGHAHSPQAPDVPVGAWSRPPGVLGGNSREASLEMCSTWYILGNSKAADADLATAQAAGLGATEAITGLAYECNTAIEDFER